MLVVQVLVPPDELKRRLTLWAHTSSQYPYFKGSSQELSSWFASMEVACECCEIPKVQWVDAAVELIQVGDERGGDLADVMRDRKRKFLETSREPYWRWEDFKRDLTRIVLEAERIMKQESETPFDKTKAAFEKMREDHPFVFASAGTALMIGGSFVIVPAIGILALNAIGFTSAGVAGGSLAALAQSAFYRGATTGVFSLLQSAGATAVLPAAGSIVAGTSAFSAGLASLVYGAKPSHVAGSGSLSRKEKSESPPPYSPPKATPEKTTLPASVPYEVYRARKSRRA